MSHNLAEASGISSNRELKGKHVFGAFVLFFAVIIAVNFTMARLASTTWTGLVVKNSYVASQQFNEELENAKRQQANGWSSSVTYGSDTLVFTAEDKVGNLLTVTNLIAEIGRPAFEQQDRVLTFVPLPNGQHKISLELEPGVWALKITGLVNGENYRRDLRMRVDDKGRGTLQ